MKTELCGPLRPPHRPAACCWSSIPAPDRRRMSPDRKHRQSHRRRPCRTHCPDRKAWAAFPPPSAPKGRRQCPNRSGPCHRDCLPAPPKGPRRYPRPQQAPPTWKCSPPCGPGRAPDGLPCGVVRQAAARRCAAEFVPESTARGVSSPAAVSARRSPPARWSRIRPAAATLRPPPAAAVPAHR